MRLIVAVWVLIRPLVAAEGNRFPMNLVSAEGGKSFWSARRRLSSILLRANMAP
jgi:hypothetical protein